MPRPKFAHSYARYKLEQNKLGMYHGTNRILSPVKTATKGAENKWNYGEFESSIIQGNSIFPSDMELKSKIIRDYEELSYRTGLMISARTPSIQRFVNQKVEYFLTAYSQFKRNVGEIPRGHIIELDIHNRQARLIGSNSLAEWITYRRTNIGGQGYYGKPGYFIEREPSYEDLLSEHLNVDVNEVIKIIPIKEIIVGISLDDGRVVTIPEENFNPIMFICGRRRMGKTFLHYRLMDNFYHKWNKKCIDMIDIAHESETHSLEWGENKFTSQLSQIGETTRALPLVYLNPSTNDLKTILLKDEVGFKITIPFKEWILDFENILKGNEQWEFKKTAVYFRNLLYDDNGNIRRDGLLKCKTFDEIKTFVMQDIKKNSSVWGIKNPEGVISKIINVIKDIYNAKILDISTNHKAKWTIKYPNGSKESYHPWTACLIADLIPVIVTSNLRWHQSFYPHYMKYISEDIYKMQTENEEFLKNKSEIFYFFNELTSIVDSSKPTVMNDTFDMIIRESGPNRIGVVFGTQYIDKVPELPKSQSNYIFSFRQNEKGADQLVKDFDALKSLKSDFLKLKQFQCMAYPNESPFHMYDEDGNMEVLRDEPVRMMIYPPLSSHKPPKEV